MLFRLATIVRKKMIKSKLIAIRTQKGFSQEKLADLIGMGQSSYSRREKGLVPITEHEWIKIAKQLGVDIETIYEKERNYFAALDESNNRSNLHNPNQFPDNILETIQKYVAKLEEENQQLKNQIKK